MLTLLGSKPVLLLNYEFLALWNPVWLHNMRFCILNPLLYPFPPFFGISMAPESNCDKKICFWLTWLGRKPVLLPNYAFWTLWNPIWLHNRWFCVLDPFWSLFLSYFDQLVDLHTTLKPKIGWNTTWNIIFIAIFFYNSQIFTYF